MGYATPDDLDAAQGPAIVDLLTIDEETGARDAAKIQRALDDASATVSSYIATRYPAPIALSAEGISLLKGYTADIAVYRLASTADRLTDIIRDRYKDALAWLRDVAAAKADIPVIPDAAAAPISPNEAVIDAPNRVMSRRSLRGW